ncbi:MAG: PilZ domain-containing protein [Solimonas sp.]
MTVALAYRETLPFAWHAAPAGDSEPPALWVEQNLRLLTAVATLNERARVEAETPGAVEFERLHHKFDLMIELLGALLRATQGLPAPWPLRIGGESLSWPLEAGAPAVGSVVDVTVYLHPAAPAAWRWRGTVEAHRDGELVLRYAGMPEALASALERQVFIRHRRSVADARSPAHRGEV